MGFMPQLQYRRRRYSKLSLEVLAETAEGSEAGKYGHLGDIVTSLFQQLHASMQFAFAYIGVSAHPRESFQFAVERGYTHRYLVGEECNVYFLGAEVVVDQFVKLVQKIAVKLAELWL